jgi:membrane-bound lytic murein transglycosylase MltF
VKESLQLLTERRWYSQARWGYAKAGETRIYIRNIRNYYDILVWLEDGPEDYREPGQPGTPAVTADDRSDGRTDRRSGVSRDRDTELAAAGRG